MMTLGLLVEDNYSIVSSLIQDTSLYDYVYHRLDLDYYRLVQIRCILDQSRVDPNPFSPNFQCEENDAWNFEVFCKCISCLVIGIAKILRPS